MVSIRDSSDNLVSTIGCQTNSKMKFKFWLLIVIHMAYSSYKQFPITVQLEKFGSIQEARHIHGHPVHGPPDKSLDIEFTFIVDY